MKTSIYIVITPVRDEAPRIQQTVNSMASQTRRPAKWIIVDDGSTDGTAEILESAARRHAWIAVMSRPDRGSRAPGSGVMDAFYLGYESVQDTPWDFLVKLDADLAFDSEYFAKCLEKFREDGHLGIGGGSVCLNEGGHLRVEAPSDPPFHVRGATKIYRRQCFFDIQPLAVSPGWDTIDEIKANAKGWRTRTFRDVQLIQTKKTGAADGIWADAFKNGRANYITGYDPLFMAIKCIKRAFTTPPVICGTALAAGYVSGCLKQVPRLSDRATVRYLRAQQRRRLLLRRSIYSW